jgi:hypothetical protein
VGDWGTQVTGLVLSAKHFITCFQWNKMFLHICWAALVLDSCGKYFFWCPTFSIPTSTAYNCLIHLQFSVLIGQKV